MNRKPTQIIRVSPEVHRLAKIEATKSEITLQQWLESLIKKELQVLK